MKKKKYLIVLFLVLSLFLSACAKAPEKEEEPLAPEETPVQETETNTVEEKTLVVVFSATGTTLGVAKKIAAIEDADLYEIKAKEAYSDADLNWNDKNSRSTLEQNDDSVRPEIGSEALSLEGYTKIYVGFPIWWGEEPRILDTFVESYDFSGITMIPFCTSSSSGIGRSGKNLEEHAGNGNWLEGKRFSGSVSETDLASWIDSLK
ncbi:MAG: flavodoxin [Erysipelotrichaceae bacterium]|nr:flavodoxin [Erysipelotrichaceae bacterium]